MKADCTVLFLNKESAVQRETRSQSLRGPLTGNWDSEVYQSVYRLLQNPETCQLLLEHYLYAERQLRARP